MKINDILTPLTEAAVPVISKQDAIDQGFFGPVWHGSSQENLAKIGQTGFKISGIDADVTAENGYTADNGSLYAQRTGIFPPIQHLGYGVYFTTSRACAIKYNRGSAKGLVEYYLDTPRVETINFAAMSTQMRWWLANGYNMPSGEFNTSYRHLRAMRHDATKHLTDTLKSKYDAVRLLAKVMGGRGIDDPQICVFDPRRIYRIDPSLSSGLDIGAKVTHNQSIPDKGYREKNNIKTETDPDGWTRIKRLMDVDSERWATIHEIPPPGMKGTIVAKRATTKEYHGENDAFYDVKWAKGGVKYNYYASELTPSSTGKTKPSA